MADTTAFLGLTKPTVGASRDTWGALLNDDLDVIDSAVNAAMPVGAMLDYAGADAPGAGWLLCDNSLYQVADHPALFAKIGARYGGDGVTNFRVPDTRGRSTVGVGTGTDLNGFTATFYLAQQWGYYFQSIGQANLPDYILPETSAGQHQHSGTGYTEAAGDHYHTGFTDVIGAHNHGYIAPNLGAGYWIGGDASRQITDNNGYATAWAGDHQHNVQTYNSGPHQHTALTIWTNDGAAGAHSHQPRLGGSGVPIWTMAPGLVATKIIFAGITAQARSTGPAPAGRLTLRAPMRGMH